MSKLKFCRICLDNNVRMHRISGSEVEDVYEKLIKKKIQDDGKLYFACYICYCQLKNSQQLVIKSQKSKELLNQISVYTPELNLKAIPFLDRLLCGLQNSLIVSNIVSLQIPEYNKNIKTENQAESDTYETCNTTEPDDDRALPNKEPKLEEKYNISQFKDNAIETEKIDISATKTVANKNKSPQLLYDGNNKQVLVKNDKKIYVCDNSGKTCDSKAVLITHISGHNPVMTKPNKAYISIHKSKFDGKMVVHDNSKKEFKCQYCNYISVRRDNLTDHIRTHTGERPFKCQYCSYRCTVNGSLKRHIRTHTGEKPFKCQYCSYTFTDKSNLKLHIRTHTGEKPFKCQYCIYTCTQNSTLKSHIRTHTGEKPFKCQYCSYTCTQNSALKSHMRSHTREKPFKCQHCNYTCKRNIHLKNHIRTHTGEKPFKCQYCSYTCTVNSSLKRHIRTHTGEKPFKCQYCSYTCAENSKLKVHIRTHTEEKPYICDICNNKFIACSALKQHLRVHMDNKSH